MSTLLSISGGRGPSLFQPKMERTQPEREAMDGKVLIVGSFTSGFPIMEILYNNSTLIWLVNK